MPPDNKQRPFWMGDVFCKPEKSRINDIRRFRLEDESYIPFLGGRPERGHIRADDITDLKIVLNTCKSCEEFLEII